MAIGLKTWFRSGDPWVWLSASAVSTSLIMVFGLLALIAVRGLGYFWPADIAELDYREPSGETVRLIGEMRDREQVSVERLRDSGLPVPPGRATVTRYLMKGGNRDVTGLDFRWSHV